MLNWLEIKQRLFYKQIMKLLDQVIKRFEEKYKQSDTPWVRDQKKPAGLDEFSKFLKPSSEILDIGCGDGWIDFILAEYGFNVTGIDSSQTAIQKAKKKAVDSGNLEFIVGDALEFNFSKNSFDAVFDRGLLHHIPEENWDDYRNGINKILKPNGIFYLATFSDDSVKKGFDPKKEGRMWHKVKDSSGYWTYDHFFTPKLIQEFLGKYYKLLWQDKDEKSSANGSVLIYSIFKKEK